jgi:hypothetical protein
MSNDDNWNQDQPQDSFDREYDADQRRAPKQGMSTGMKVLIVLVCIFGGGGLLCCGGMAYFFYQIAPKISDRPEEVIALQKEIADISLPAELKPKQSVKFDNFMFAMKMVMFESGDSKSSLMLTEAKAKMAGQNPQQDAQMRDAMRQQGMETGPLAKVESTTKKLKVKGAERDFQFSSGEDAGTGRKMRQISGGFPGRNGDAHLMYRVEEEAYKEEDVVKMIESIQ